MGMRVSVLRALFVGGGVLVLSLLAFAAQPVAAKPGPGGGAPSCPTFSSSNFDRSTSANVTNRYFPLMPGDLYTYKGNVKKEPVVDTVYVTHNTRRIAGVTTVEVLDQVETSGVLTEKTLDWYAQDKQGNVWYFGEASTEFPTGSTAGSWTAGVDGAQPGYIMEANPQAGDSYCQESAPGVAQDAAQVLSRTASRSVLYGDFKGSVLQTKDFSLIEPHSEYKYYALDIGMIEAVALSGGNEDLQLYSIQHNQ
jgi:hypothetical protein